MRIGHEWVSIPQDRHISRTGPRVFRGVERDQSGRRAPSHFGKPVPYGPLFLPIDERVFDARVEQSLLGTTPDCEFSFRAAYPSFVGNLIQATEFNVPPFVSPHVLLLKSLEPKWWRLAKSGKDPFHLTYRVKTIVGPQRKGF